MLLIVTNHFSDQPVDANFGDRDEHFGRTGVHRGSDIVMILYQDFNFDTISIWCFENIAISISIFLKW